MGDPAGERRIVVAGATSPGTAVSGAQAQATASIEGTIPFASASDKADRAQVPGPLAALVCAMRRQEVSAFAMVPEGARILPAAYPLEVENEFRSHFESLDFPAALRLLSLEDAPADPLQNVGQEAHRILIVDDAPSIVRVLGAMLQGCGTLRFALSGEQALEVARAWMPSLVLTDLQMDGMSGIELCRRLKELPETAEATIIIISSDNQVANEVSALSAGAVDFIEKPISSARVIARVNTQLAIIEKMRGFHESMAGESEKIPIGFITLSLSGDIIEMNPAVARRMGRPTSSFRGQHFCSLFEPSQRAGLSEALENLASTGKSMSIEALMVGATSAVLPMRIVGWSAPGLSGRILWIAIEDLRDWRLAERNRSDARISNQIASITSGIAHEFNNLLNIVLGNLDLLGEGESSAVRQRRLVAASKAAERAAGISRRLGDSARPLSKSTPQLVNLTPLIEELWPLLVNSLPLKIRLTKEIAPDLPGVLIEARLIRDALWNLIQNAYDAMPSGGMMALSARVEPADPEASNGAKTAFVVVEVRDEGAGMTKAVADQAFDPFFTTRAPERTGLGLTAVRNTVTGCGGTVHIRSSPGKGTVVTLRLPTLH